MVRAKAHMSVIDTPRRRPGSGDAPSADVTIDRARWISRTWWISVVAVAGAVMFVMVVNAWGRALQSDGHRLFANLPPLVARLDPHIAWSGVIAIAFVPIAAVFAPRIATKASWRWVLAAAFAGAATWAVALALTEGAAGLVRSPSRASDYLASVPLIHDPTTFLDTFVERIGSFTTHVRAHPPAMALVAWTLDRLGGGPGAMAALEILVGASAIPAVLIAVRDVAGEDRARAAAPFLTFAPAAVTLASSGDALFMGVGAWAVCLVVLATGARRRWVPLAVGGGFLFGVVAFLSYGLVLLAVIPVAVAVRRRRLTVLVVAALGAAPVFTVFLAAGFWWVEGLLATRLQYLGSAARTRPYGYFAVGNLASFAIVIGPAAIAGLTRLSRSATLWPLVVGALVAVALADLSGMSKAEVERIWLPFVPWVLASSALLPPRVRWAWFATNVIFAFALEIAVTQPW
jgi:methylthioxylose transferase